MFRSIFIQTVMAVGQAVLQREREGESEVWKKSSVSGNTELSTPTAERPETAAQSGGQVTLMS